MKIDYTSNLAKLPEIEKAFIQHEKEMYLLARNMLQNKPRKTINMKLASMQKEEREELKIYLNKVLELGKTLTYSKKMKSNSYRG